MSSRTASPARARAQSPCCSLSLTWNARAEFNRSEWEETRAETLEQLREFEAFMERSMAGDMTLVDEFSAAQLVRARVCVCVRARLVRRLRAPCPR
jgi:hypothetical protein